jgi:hypothetical protein
MSSVFQTSLVHAVKMTYLVAGKEKGWGFWGQEYFD